MTLDQRVVFFSLLSTLHPCRLLARLDTCCCSSRSIERAASTPPHASSTSLRRRSASSCVSSEDRLGGPLLRKWRRLIATAAGRRLTDIARALLGELSRAEDEVRNLIRGSAGSLRVATSCHQSYAWLPGVLRAFAARCPGVEVTVVADGVDAPCDALLARKLDVALVTSDTRACAASR